MPPARNLPAVATGQTRMVVVQRTSKRSTWIAIVFAIVAVLAAGGAVTAYLLRPTTHTAAPLSQGTPEAAVREFLSAVFLGDDLKRLDPVVCASWTASDALTRTRGMVPSDAKVSWDDLRVVSDASTRVSMTARLGLRLPDDIQPSVYQQWHFTVVKEQGWRVCDAAPTVG